MTTFYIDPELGSDAANGTSFATAWKTIGNGATAGRLTAGDIIRIKASKAPTLVGDATFTKGATKRNVYLENAVTLNIDQSQTIWNASANVTPSLSTTPPSCSNLLSPVNTYWTKLDIAAGFTTGKVAWSACATQNLSTMQQVSLLMASSAALADGLFNICLCSDANGDVPVHTIPVAAMPLVNGAGYMQPLTYDTGAALSNNINSVALYAVTDPGMRAIYLKNIIACKAPSSNDSLTLNSLVGLGDGFWWPLSGIDGTTLRIFFGTSPYTGTLPLYKREPFKLSSPATGTQVTVSDMLFNKEGTGPDARITYSGGWNRLDMSTQNLGDYSIFDGQNGGGYGALLQKAHVKLDQIGFVRFYQCLYGSTTALATIPRGLIFTNCFSAIQSNFYNVAGLVLDGFKGLWNTQFFTGDAVIKSSAFKDGYSGGAVFVAGSNISIVDSEISDNYFSGVYTGSSAKNIKFVRCNFHDSSGGSITSQGGSGIACYGSSETQFIDCDISDSTFCTPSTSGNNRVEQINSPLGVYKTTTDYGTVTRTSETKHSATGYAWQMSPTNAIRNSACPLEHQMMRRKVKAGVTYAFDVWVMRDNTGLYGRIGVKIGGAPGVYTDTWVNASVDANVWEKLTINYVATDDGWAEITAQCWGGTTYSMYVDDYETAAGLAPAPADLRSGSACRVDDVSVSGSLAVPAAADVRKNTPVDAGLGLAYIPAAYNVVFGVPVDQATGLAHMPAAADVRSGVDVDQGVGSLVVPPANKVDESQTFDNGTQGTLHVPVTDDFTTADIAIGVTKTVKDVSVEGSYDGSDRFTSIPPDKVEQDYQYLDNAVERIGTMECPVSTDPGEGNVVDQTEYMINNVPHVGSFAVSKAQGRMTQRGEIESLTPIGTIENEFRPYNTKLPVGTIEDISLIGTVESVQ